MSAEDRLFIKACDQREDGVRYGNYYRLFLVSPTLSLRVIYFPEIGIEEYYLHLKPMKWARLVRMIQVFLYH